MIFTACAPIAFELNFIFILFSICIDFKSVYLSSFQMVQFYCGLHTVRAQIRSQTANFMRLCENDNDDNVYDESRAAAHHRMN